MGAGSPKANHPTRSLLTTNLAIINMLITSEENEVPKAPCTHTHNHGSRCNVLAVVRCLVMMEV
jgi:hypothetical protein